MVSALTGRAYWEMGPRLGATGAREGPHEGNKSSDWMALPPHEGNKSSDWTAFSRFPPQTPLLTWSVFYGASSTHPG